MPLIKIKPPLIALTLLILSLLLHFLVPLFKPIPEPYNFLGLIISIMALVLASAARNEFKKAGTPLLPSAKSTVLVGRGPFRFTRNPMYMGLSSLLAGFGVFMNSIYIFIAAWIFFLIINIVFIPYEEEDLEKTFGQEYIEYKKKVRRWI
jgi:protein-S-isoprenylcysteine O-methyltransferase Ste14